MTLIPNNAQWNALQSQIDHDIPDEKWILRQLDTNVRPMTGNSCVQAIVERAVSDSSGDQVVGVGSTEEAAIRAAIQLARYYPPARHTEHSVAK
ncbi:MAG: hypothetical protein ACR2OU_15910 [Thermomicrobiales bacterium]